MIVNSQKVLNSAPTNFQLHLGDYYEILSDMESEFVHMVLTDPPYFLDGLDDDWKKGNGGKRGTGTVEGLPIGMKFDVNQGLKLQQFMTPIAKELFRIIKLGGFVLMFSAPRLYHRMAIAVEDAGFEISIRMEIHQEITIQSLFNGSLCFEERVLDRQTEKCSH
ncbi:MAG: hypothetical protein OXC02_03225 [Rhodobacteraceae bacterium]|nr:hypothetical protein [Paracoccaceae bacterium]